MKKLIFFLIASAILIFSIIVVTIAPIINGKVGGRYWFTPACGQLSDEYNYAKKQNYGSEELKDKTLKPLEKNKNRCYRKKAMYGLEYTTSDLNLIFGFVCTLLGFLQFLNVINIGKYIGLIGLGTGFIGFVLTFVYVIESGLVFDDITDSRQIRIDSDGAFLEWNRSKNRYTCIFYDKDDADSVLLRYSGYGNKYLSYRQDVFYAQKEGNFKYLSTNGCRQDTITAGDLWDNCKDLEEFDDNQLTSSSLSDLNSKRSYYDSTVSRTNKKGECDFLFRVSSTASNSYKQTYDNWLTTIIFSCFIFIFHIGLAIFGFLLFRESDGSSGQVAIK